MALRSEVVVKPSHLSFPAELRSGFAYVLQHARRVCLRPKYFSGMSPSGILVHHPESVCCVSYVPPRPIYGENDLAMHRRRNDQLLAYARYPHRYDLFGAVWSLSIGACAASIHRQLHALPNSFTNTSGMCSSAAHIHSCRIIKKHR